MVARARDGVLYYTSWYTNISLSRLYSTVTEGIQIFQPPPPAPANATAKDDVLAQPRQYHSWQRPLTMASGADGHCQTCVHIFMQTSPSLSNCLCSTFAASRSTGDLEVRVCALTHTHSLETASFTASGADGTAECAYICSYEQAVLFCARCSHPSRRADKLEVGHAHCVREHT